MASFGISGDSAGRPNLGHEAADRLLLEVGPVKASSSSQSGRTAIHDKSAAQRLMNLWTVSTGVGASWNDGKVVDRCRLHKHARNGSFANLSTET
jgi:hypothetical protein